VEIKNIMKEECKNFNSDKEFTEWSSHDFKNVLKIYFFIDNAEE